MAAIYLITKDLAPAAGWSAPSELDITDELHAWGFTLVDPSKVACVYEDEGVLAPPGLPPGASAVVGYHVGWRGALFALKMSPSPAPGQPPSAWRATLCNTIGIGVRFSATIKEA